LRLAEDHQDGAYICKWCKPPKGGPRYLTFDRVAYSREHNLQRRHGITAADYDRMLASQDGRCAICQKPPRKNRLHVDHDRSCCPGPKSCGKCVRGLLCVSCNSKLEWWLTYQVSASQYVQGLITGKAT
jgi:hypothetical protein